MPLFFALLASRSMNVTQVRTGDLVSAHHPEERTLFSVVYHGQRWQIVLHEQFQCPVQCVVRSERPDVGAHEVLGKNQRSQRRFR